MIKYLCDDASHSTPSLADFGMETTEESYSTSLKHYCREHFRELLQSFQTGAMKPQNIYSIWRIG